MNITEYYLEGDSTAQNYRCRATLKQGYTVIDADEAYYRYVGSNSVRAFTKIVHPDDAECVLDALEHLDEKPQRLIFRLQRDDGIYRYMYGVFDYNGRQQEGFRFIDVNMLDIMCIHYRFDVEHIKLQKYRKFMSQSDELYFEYSYATDRLVIFEYVNDRSIVRLNDSLSAIQDRVSQSAEYTFKQTAEFESFQEYLNTAAEIMDLELDGEIFGLDCGYLLLNGDVLYINNAKEMMAGTIKVMGKVKRDDKYYLSPHAFDNATGVYNKRAIKELAMDLIATAKDNKVFLSVMDIDDFKNINDTYGHMKGDEVIAKVAEIIRTTLGNRGYVGRFGGDEFMVVADKVKDADDFANIFKTIRKNIMWCCGEILSNMEVTLSLGLAAYPDHASNYEELFKISDKCLYIAKAKGKNRLISYEPELHANFEMAVDANDKRMPMTFEQSCNVLVEILENFGMDNPERFDKSVQQFLQRYNIDRVMIYLGDDYKIAHKIFHPDLPENVPAPIDNMAFWNQENAAALFDKKGMLVRNKVLQFADTHPQVYEALDRQGTMNFMAVKICPAGGPRMLVFFDVIRRPRKWGGSDEGLLHIAAWLIAQRYMSIHENKESGGEKEK